MNAATAPAPSSALARGAAARRGGGVGGGAGAQAAGVHERRDRPGLVVGGRQLGVGDQVAQRGLPAEGGEQRLLRAGGGGGAVPLPAAAGPPRGGGEPRPLRAGDGGGDVPDRLVGDRRGDGGVPVDQGLHLRVGRHVPGDDHVLGGLGQHAPTAPAAG